MVMKQLSAVMKDPLYITGASQELTGLEMPTKLGPEWNPRSLSSFSTFGASSGAALLLNGHVEVNGNGLDHELLTNGSVSPVHDSESGSSSPDVSTAEDTDIKANMNGIMSKKVVYLVSDNKKSHHDPKIIPTRQPSQVAVVTNGMPIPGSLLDRLAPAAFNHSRPTSEPHYANSDVIITGPRHISTRVPPPVAPRHTHSKSLVGEELSSVIPIPSHGHSRSLVEDGFAKIPLKAQDGHDVREASLFLGSTDRRFGFSVVGGSDEVLASRIDEIAQGSPADKADLEVGDEILEVNGKNLEDATHAEVISHIHQCIRSRTICLRVKRRTGNKLAADLAASSNVQDAFVIAVEQRARERLERLSALKKIKPVDMTKLSSQLTDPLDSSHSPGSGSTASKRTGASRRDSKDDVNGLLESSPIYVTSVPNLTSSAITNTQKTTTAGPKASPRSCSRTSSSSPQHRTSSGSPPPNVKETRTEGRHQHQHRTSSKRRHSSSSSRNPASSSSSTCVTNGHSSSKVPQTEVELDGNKSGDELELTHDLNEECGVEDSGEELDRDQNAGTGDSRSEDDLEDTGVSESGDSLPATPEKTYGIAIDSFSREFRANIGPKEVLLDSLAPQERAHSPLEHTPSLESASSRKSGGSASSSSGGGGGGRRGSGAPYKPSKSGPRGSSKGAAAAAASSVPQEGGESNMISMVEFDPAKREMAVDVPDTFIGRTKTPPRYPPPKPGGGVGYGQPLNPLPNGNSSTSSKGSKRGGTGGSSGSITPINGSLPKTVSPQRVPQIPTSGESKHVVVQSPNSQEEANKLKRYEEEIKQRREREEEVAELHKTSIRDSQKLRALASYPQGQRPRTPPAGITNQAFENDDTPPKQKSEGSPLKSDSPSINELIDSLQRIQTVLKSNGHRISEDMDLVSQLLTNPEFQKVLAVHNKVQETWCMQRPPTPVADNAQRILTECLEALQETTSPEAMELVDLLNKYCLEGLLYAHDRIAEREPPPSDESPPPEEVELTPPTQPIQQQIQRQPQPQQPPPPQQDVGVLNDRVLHNYPEVNVKIVRIDKTHEALGATIRNEGDAVIIARIVRGGAAEKSGLLHEGDEILEVNDIEVRGKSVNDVCDLLANMSGTLTFIINPCNSNATAVPNNTQPEMTTPPIYVKTYFDYDPEDDLYIPCRELGISFTKGDILQIKKQDDPNWWQAYRVGDNDQTLAGLIPSPSFQQQREAMRQTVAGDTESKEKTKKPKLLCAKKNQKKKKKKMLYPNYNEDFDNEEILTYEEVDLYYPRANRKRPIVLIGPPNIGRYELRQKLMADGLRFAAAVPHTSRPKKDIESDGQEYHFVSRAQFEADILARKFVEHGEYEKAYYGTSLDAIQSVVTLGKICVLNLHPLSLKMLKNSDLKPYVIFIAPPSLEKLKQMKQRAGEPVKEDELKETIQKAREIEDQYGHYFDLIIINKDVEGTYHSLIHYINILEREPQWVPASWLRGEEPPR